MGKCTLIETKFAQRCKLNKNAPTKGIAIITPTPQFVQQIVQAIDKENTKAPHYWPFVTVIHRGFLPTSVKIVDLWPCILSQKCYNFTLRAILCRPYFKPPCFIIIDNINENINALHNSLFVTQASSRFCRHPIQTKLSWRLVAIWNYWKGYQS